MNLTFAVSPSNSYFSNETKICIFINIIPKELTFGLFQILILPTPGRVVDIFRHPLFITLLIVFLKFVELSTSLKVYNRQ